MRPRINKFGKITFNELHQYLTDNYVFGFLGERIDANILSYSYHIMFRDNKKDPETLYITVSRTSKLVLSAYTDRHRTFNNIDELKKYTKK